MSPSYQSCLYCFELEFILAYRPTMPTWGNGQRMLGRYARIYSFYIQPPNQTHHSLSLVKLHTGIFMHDWKINREQLGIEPRAFYRLLKNPRTVAN